MNFFRLSNNGTVAINASEQQMKLVDPKTKSITGKEFMDSKAFDFCELDTTSGSSSGQDNSQYQLELDAANGYYQ